MSPAEIYEKAKKQHDQNLQRLLIVEDNDELRNYLTHTLSDNYTIQTCSNGKEALTIVKEYMPELIISDIMMPVMDGYQAARAIRGSGKKDAETIPIIAMTANAFSEDIMDSRLAGMDIHLAKPLDEAKMINALKQCIAERSAVKLRNDL